MKKHVKINQTIVECRMGMIGKILDEQKKITDEANQ
jgi:hypothetical protein